MGVRPMSLPELQTRLGLWNPAAAAETRQAAQAAGQPALDDPASPDGATPMEADADGAKPSADASPADVAQAATDGDSGQATVKSETAVKCDSAVKEEAEAGARMGMVVRSAKKAKVEARQEVAQGADSAMVQAGDDTLQGDVDEHSLEPIHDLYEALLSVVLQVSSHCYRCPPPSPHSAPPSHTGSPLHHRHAISPPICWMTCLRAQSCVPFPWPQRFAWQT